MPVAPAEPALAGHLHDPEVVEEELAVAGQGRPVVLQQTADAVLQIGGARLGEQVRRPARASGGSATKRRVPLTTSVSPRRRTCGAPVEGPPEPVVAAERVEVRLREPHLEVRHGGEPSYGRAVVAPRAQQHGAPLRRGVAVLPARDSHARQQPLDVPLPGTRVRLVEVPDVEHEPPRRGLVEAEVADVRVAVELDHDPCRRRPGEIVGHHRGGALEEGEGRRGHPRHAQRDQAGTRSTFCRSSRTAGAGRRLDTSRSAWQDKGHDVRAARPSSGLVGRVVRRSCAGVVAGATPSLVAVIPRGNTHRPWTASPLAGDHAVSRCGDGAGGPDHGRVVRPAPASSANISTIGAALLMRVLRSACRAVAARNRKFICPAIVDGARKIATIGHEFPHRSSGGSRGLSNLMRGGG